MPCFARHLSLLFIMVALAAASKAIAGEITVAVAANFAGTLESLRKDFEGAGDRKLTVISGATGKLVAQISEGAPFDVFLSADDKATKKLVESGQAVAGSEFTYAIGTLALFSGDPELIKGDGETVLKGGSFSRIAIANPKIAPYGAAAEETMKKLNVHVSLKNKIVMGENIGQTFAMIDSGGAELGFVALSQVIGSEAARRGSYWTVPESLHDPIRQNAVLLMRAKANSDAGAFLDFLQSPEVRNKIEAAGYTTENQSGNSEPIN